MKKKKPKPKPRGVWKINPKTRVEPSEKIYKRPKAKREARNSISDQINWFGTSAR